jgi:hypothetical protein
MDSRAESGERLFPSVEERSVRSLKSPQYLPQLVVLINEGPRVPLLPHRGFNEHVRRWEDGRGGEMPELWHRVSVLFAFATRKAA